MKRTRLFCMAVTLMALFFACSTKPAPAQAGSSVVNHGLIASLGILDFSGGGFQLTFINVEQTANNYVFSYSMAGTISGAGSGSIPASSVNVSGGPLNHGNVTVALNLNTCGLDPSSFTTSQGSCGTFDITFVEIPPSEGGSTTTSGSTHQTMPGMGTTIINGHTETVTALLSGTALGYVLLNGPYSQLIELTQATVTHTK